MEQPFMGRGPMISEANEIYRADLLEAFIDILDTYHEQRIGLSNNVTGFFNSGQL